MQGDAIAISCSGQLHGGSIQGPIQRRALAWDSTRIEKRRDLCPGEFTR